jgi:hypothetical protein
MGLFHSKLSTAQAEILRHSSGLTIEEIRPHFKSIATYVFKDLRSFQKHSVSDSVSFLVIRGEYIINTKSTFGGKSTYYL